MAKSDTNSARREKLVRLVTRIQSESGCIVDVDALIEQFEQAVPNSAASQYLFDPPDGKPRTPDEIVDIALDRSGNP